MDGGGSLDDYVNNPAFDGANENDPHDACVEKNCAMLLPIFMRFYGMATPLLPVPLLAHATVSWARRFRA